MNRIRLFALLLCLCLLAGTVFADDPQPSECDHDYTLVAYEAPRYRAPGFERYRGTKCGDEYEIELPQLVERAPNWSYDFLSNATSDHLTIFVGYYGMSYTQKITLFPAGHSRFAKEGTLQEKLDELFG